jgi:hypothetical protein
LQFTLEEAGHSRQFGRCVKALDIFLRIAICHVHLRTAFRLAAFEAQLNLPLDNWTTTNVRKQPEGAHLRAVTVSGLTEDDYVAYQAAAAAIALREGIHRVWLEDLYWGVQEKPAKTSVIAEIP